MIEIRLPFPPSSNNLFAGRVRRYATGTYRRWRAAAGWELVAQRIKPMAGPVSIEVELSPPDKRPRDCDNHLKAIVDLIVQQGLLPDDNGKHVRGVSAHWAQQPGSPGATVRIRPAA